MKKALFIFLLLITLIFLGSWGYNTYMKYQVKKFSSDVTAFRKIKKNEVKAIIEEGTFKLFNVTKDSFEVWYKYKNEIKKTKTIDHKKALLNLTPFVRIFKNFLAVPVFLIMTDENFYSREDQISVYNDEETLVADVNVYKKGISSILETKVHKFEDLYKLDRILQSDEVKIKLNKKVFKLNKNEVSILKHFLNYTKDFNMALGSSFQIELIDVCFYKSDPVKKKRYIEYYKLEKLID